MDIRVRRARGWRVIYDGHPVGGLHRTKRAALTWADAYEELLSTGCSRGE